MSTHTVAAVPQAVPLTSEISSEVELAPEVEVNVLITFATAFKSFNKSLTPQVRKAALVVKAAFGVRPGYLGRTLMVEGRELEWKAFVKKYFGITPRRFNQIMEFKDDEAQLKPAKPKTLRVVAPTDDDRDITEKFEEQETRIAELEEKKAELEAEVALLRAGETVVDPVQMLLGLWRKATPEQVRDELSRIIDGLDLGGYLKVETTWVAEDVQ